MKEKERKGSEEKQGEARETEREVREQGGRESVCVNVKEGGRKG